MLDSLANFSSFFSSYFLCVRLSITLARRSSLHVSNAIACFLLCMFLPGLEVAIVETFLIGDRRMKLKKMVGIIVTWDHYFSTNFITYRFSIMRIFEFQCEILRRKNSRDRLYYID